MPETKKIASDKAIIVTKSKVAAKAVLSGKKLRLVNELLAKAKLLAP